jgi:hypothetical protein
VVDLVFGLERGFREGDVSFCSVAVGAEDKQSRKDEDGLGDDAERVLRR